MKTRSHCLISQYAAKPGLLLLFVGWVLLPTVTFAAASSFEVDRIVDETNKLRATYDLPPLLLDTRVELVAVQKARQLAQTGEFTHDIPGRASTWEELRRAGYSYKYAGENLAVHYRDASDVVRAWYRSPVHRANLLNPNFTHIGIGVAPGHWFGHDGEVAVQLFAEPLPTTTYTTRLLSRSP